MFNKQNSLEIYKFVLFETVEDEITENTQVLIDKMLTHLFLPYSLFFFRYILIPTF